MTGREALGGVLGKAGSMLVLVMLTGLLSGCEWNDFFNPGEPKIFGPDQKPLVVPILDTLASGIEEPDAQFSDATDIEPGDLVPDVSDYKIGPNDLVNVSIFDLLGEGTGEQVKTVRVTETGSVSLPFIPPVKAEGLTERELENAVSKAYEDARLIRNARVAVTVSEARARTFSVQGNVASPGEFQITRPDYRMLDALVTAHGPQLAIGVPYAYVIRKNTPPGQSNTSTPSNSTIEPTPPSNNSNTNNSGNTGNNPSPNPNPNTNSPLTPAPQPNAPTSQPGDLLSPPPTTPAGPQGRANPPLTPGHIVALDNLRASSGQIFTFDDLEAPTDQRIIRVPIDQLRQYGELKYNIVVRPGDMIIVPDPVNGVYYFGGHVLRPGVFSLSGQSVTLKDGWIAAGGADDFAFPNRAEVVRRIGTHREVCVRIDLSKILAMSEPDIYLKPNDVVYVGTNFFAPFLAAVRNSFRLTYGFGFLYDRNFYTGANGF